MKKYIYGAMSTALLAAPLVASAQFTRLENNAQTSGLPNSSIYQIIGNMMNYLLAIIGFLGIIGFVISGILFLTAAGSEDRMKQAKNAALYSIIGIIVALVGFIIIRAAAGALSADTTF